MQGGEMNEGGHRYNFSPEWVLGRHVRGVPVLVEAQSLSRVRLWRPHGLWRARPLWPWGSPARALEWVAIPFSTKQGFMASTSAGHEGAQRDRDSWRSRHGAGTQEAFHAASPLRASSGARLGARRLPWGGGAACPPPQPGGALETGAQVNQMYLYLKLAKGRS